MTTPDDRPTPLSLDADVQLRPKSPPRRRRWLLLGLAVPLAAVGTLVTVQIWRANSLREFTPPGGEFRVRMPRGAIEAVYPANPNSPVTRDGRCFGTRHWIFRPATTAGWLDLDPEKVKLARPDDVIAAERDRRAAELGGTVAREAAVKVGALDGREVWFDTPIGPWVERYVLAPDGPTPRLFVVGAEGTAREVVESFRPR